MKITIGGFSIFFFALIRIGDAQNATLERNTRQTKCGLMNFRCTNGECIAGHLLCDGRANCADGSDETEQECSKSEIVCPEYAFRCNYGACIDGDATCNGINDCVDKSDELLSRCGNGAPVDDNATPITLTRCTGEQFKCTNGQCIRRTAICDGAVDCSDKTDETEILCSGIVCPAFTFRCTYGACIEDDLKCNGVLNCADGSDEDPRICGVTAIAPVTDIPRVTLTTSSPTGIRSANCKVPQQPENGRWLWHKTQCPKNEHCVLPTTGNELPPGTQLVYICNDGYTLNGSEDSLCGPKGSWHNTPHCVETRCRPLESTTTQADCRYGGSRISCFSPVRPGTEAFVRCQNSYQSDPTLRSVQRENVRCNATGHWEPEPITCTPVCGRISAAGTPLIVNGRRPNIAEFPWHATLYKINTTSNTKDFNCGATIIHRSLLITAAHCVYDEGYKKVEDANQYVVATGNVFLQYDSPWHDSNIVKKANVTKIYVRCNYLGLEGNYDRDIAILQIAEPFTFSSLLRPVCLDYSNFGDQNVLQVGHNGKVAGFGKTAMGTSSQILQALDVPYVSFDVCRSANYDSDHGRFVTIDKFCAGYTNGSSVCEGDSGGGLVFNTDDLWYIRGIVSIGVGSTFKDGIKTCNSYSYSLYTRISNHITWIQDVLLKFENGQEYPPCLDRSRNR